MVHYDPFEYAIHDNPYPIYKRLRDEAPVYHNSERGFYALSRWQDVWDATLDWETFSSAFGVTLEHGTKGAPMMIMMDPPDHDRLRDLVSKAFTPRRIDALEPQIRGLMDGYLAEIGTASTFDLIETIAARLPMDVISALLGVPEGEREELRDCGNEMAFREPGNPMPPDSAQRASAQFGRRIAALVAERRGAPKDDLISALVQAEVVREDGNRDRLTDEELRAFVTLINIAGNETTAKMLSSAVYWLWKFPDQRKRLVEDPSLIPNAVEELLRYDTPSQYQGRFTTRDIEKHGVVIPKASRVILLTGAANRDERQFEDPDALLIDRQFKLHISFGYGHHFCLGKSLARIELQVALEGILGRWPDYELDEAGAERVHGSNVQRGFTRLGLHV
jgi:cytochrome P450